MTMPRLHTQPAKSWLRELLLLSSAMLLSSCSSIRTTADPDFRIHPRDTYAWIDPSAPGALGDEDVPWAEFRLAIEREFSRRRIQQVTPGEATFLVRARLSLDVKTENHYDTSDGTSFKEQYEDGSLYMELLDVDSLDRVWSGECRHRLRSLARTLIGGSPHDWVPANEERRWRVEGVVARVFQRLPEEESAPGAGRSSTSAGMSGEPRP